MKKIVLLCLFVLLVACDSEKREIENAAYGYCFAMASYEVGSAERYCTEETKSTTIPMAKALVRMVDTAYIKSDTPASIEIVNVRIISDTVASVQYHKQTPIKDFIDTLEMRKRDGRWLAHSPIIKNNAAAQ